MSLYCKIIRFGVKTSFCLSRNNTFVALAKATRFHLQNFFNIVKDIQIQQKQNKT